MRIDEFTKENILEEPLKEPLTVTINGKTMDISHLAGDTDRDKANTFDKMMGKHYNKPGINKAPSHTFQRGKKQIGKVDVTGNPYNVKEQKPSDLLKQQKDLAVAQTLGRGIADKEELKKTTAITAQNQAAINKKMSGVSSPAKKMSALRDIRQKAIVDKKAASATRNVQLSSKEVTLEDTQDFHEEYGYLGYSVDDNDMFEAEYQGRTVKLNKPMRGDVKKFKVYVNNEKGNVIKVNFGHGGTSAKRPTMRIRKSNPKARKSFRARHNCKNPGPKTKARYWSCRKW